MDQLFKDDMRDRFFIGDGVIKQVELICLE
jgi:hypothetical protein